MIDFVVKLGGAAITVKEQLETLNVHVLKGAAKHVAFLHISRHSFVVVHGAGSFGHQHAAEADLANCHAAEAEGHGALIAVARTHLAVSKLNNYLVDALIAEGVPAVGLSPIGSWQTDGRAVNVDCCEIIKALLSRCIVPVIHGDVVLDAKMQYTILGGDAIVRHLCDVLQPRKAVFMVSYIMGLLPCTLLCKHLIPSIKILSLNLIRADECAWDIRPSASGA